MDPAKLKVVDLRAELSARGLDTKGVKAVLVERLKKALGINSSGEAVPQEEIENVDAVDTPLAPRTPRGGRSRRRSPSPRIDSEVSTPRRTSRRKSSVEEPAPTPAKIQHSLAQITESEREQEEQSTPVEEKLDNPSAETDSGKDSECLYSVQQSKPYEDEPDEVSSQDEVSDSVLGKVESFNASLDSKDLENLPDDKEDAISDEKSINVTGIEPLVDTPESRSEAGDIVVSIPEDKSDEPDNKQPEILQSESNLIDAREIEDQEEKLVLDESREQSGETMEEKFENAEEKSAESEGNMQHELNAEEDKPEESHVEQEVTCDQRNQNLDEKQLSMEEDDLKMQEDSSVCAMSQDSNIEETDSNKDNLSESIKMDDSPIDSPQSLDTSKSKKKEKRSRWGNFQDQKQDVKEKIAKAEEAKLEESRRGTKRKHSHSRSPVKMICEEDEVKLENPASNVLLSWFDSDLHLSIDRKTLCGGCPLITGALTHTWAGARTNKGVNSGCVAYEVIVDKHLKVDQIDDSHLIRVGFSASRTSLQLGEEMFSYGYESSGKFVSNNEFSDYGVKIHENDVIGAYLDLDSTPCTIRFTVNGKEQGIAKEFDKSDLNGQALFAHVLTKNISFRINFGQEEKSLLNRPANEKIKIEDEKKDHDPKMVENSEVSQKDESKPLIAEDSKSEENQKDVVDQMEEVDSTEAETAPTEMKDDTSVSKLEETQCKPTEKEDSIKEAVLEEPNKSTAEPMEEQTEESCETHVILPGYEYIGKVPIECLADGPIQPSERKECEVLMLCGLPGVGKTYWVEKWVREHPEKRYTVLGTHELVNRMKINGEAKKTAYKGSWQALLESCSKSISELINIAGKRRRNFIIDQNNVYTAVQVRKISNFGEFVRKAVVIVPSQEEWDKRKSTRGDLIAEEVTESEMLTMKANFVLPEANEYFDQVIFVDLPEKESKELIGKYNNEGKDAGYAMRPTKRSRFDTSSDRSSGGERSSKSSSSQGNRQGSERRYNSNERNRGDRRSDDRSQSFNRRGGNDHRKHNDRMDRGGPQRWSGPPRFGGPPPPPPHWGGGGGHRNNQWRGSGTRDNRQPAWRSGSGGERGHHGSRGDHGHHRGGGGGSGYRGGPPSGQPRGGAVQSRDGGRWNRGGQQGRGGGDSRRGQGGRGAQGGWGGNNSGWNNNGQQWNQQQQQWGDAQGWGSQQACDQQQSGQDWSGQNWNQNWQQNWNQQSWGNGWKGYGAQNWGQYWNQWNQQGQQPEGANASGAVENSGSNQISTTGSTSSTANSSQYSTSYPNVQYSGTTGNTNTSSGGGNQYSAQYSSDGNGSASGSNQNPDQMAQVYQSWAQYAQAFANYGQHQNAASAGSSNQKSGGMTDKKKKK